MLLTVKTPLVMRATVRVAAASAIFTPLAYNTVDPSVRAFTGTLTVVAPAGNATEAGTLATSVLLELRLTGRAPAGAAPESVSVMFCEPNALNVMLACGHVTVALTVTERLDA